MRRYVKELNKLHINVKIKKYGIWYESKKEKKLITLKK